MSSKKCKSIVEENRVTVKPKPPLGVMPRRIWEEKLYDFKYARRLDLARAIHQYLETGFHCPDLKLWIEELSDLVYDFDNN